jgi:hypothetical protein
MQNETFYNGVSELMAARPTLFQEFLTALPQTNPQPAWQAQPSRNPPEGTAISFQLALLMSVTQPKPPLSR